MNKNDHFSLPSWRLQLYNKEYNNITQKQNDT